MGWLFIGEGVYSTKKYQNHWFGMIVFTSLLLDNVKITRMGLWYVKLLEENCV
jgi:hypothetical protein